MKKYPNRKGLKWRMKDNKVVQYLSPMSQAFSRLIIFKKSRIISFFFFFNSQQLLRTTAMNLLMCPEVLRIKINKTWALSSRTHKPSEWYQQYALWVPPKFKKDYLGKLRRGPEREIFKLLKKYMLSLMCGPFFYLIKIFKFRRGSSVRFSGQRNFHEQG